MRQLVILIVMMLGLTACGGGSSEIQTDSLPQGTYKILKSSEIPAGLLDYRGQDLWVARKDPSGVLKFAYEGAITQYKVKHGHEPLDDLEIAAAICDWVAFNLRHPFFYPENPYLPRFYAHQYPDPIYNNFKHDPVKIISYTLSFDPNDGVNWPSPQCTQQNIAAAGIMNYAGLHARLCHVAGHDGLEYFSWKFQRWIWCDSTFNEHFLLSYPDGSSRPLGAMELQNLTLFGGIQNVQTVKHGYPNETYKYLVAFPHGFRRYAVWTNTNILNGGGSKLTRSDMVVSCLPIPDTYQPAPGELVELEKDPNTSSAFTLWSRTIDPLLIDFPLDAITVGNIITPRTNVLEINLRTLLPYATRFEVQYGTGTPWQTLEIISTPIATGRTSSIISLPWNSGVVSFRAQDNAGNTTETLNISVD